MLIQFISIPPSPPHTLEGGGRQILLKNLPRSGGGLSKYPLFRFLFENVNFHKQFQRIYLFNSIQFNSIQFNIFISQVTYTIVSI